MLEREMIEAKYDEFFGTGYWEREYKKHIVEFAFQCSNSIKLPVSGSLELLQRELNRITTANAAKEAAGENYNCLNTLGVRNAIKLIEKLSANDH